MAATKPPDGLVQRGLGERGRIGVGCRIGHTRVPVAEHDDLVVPDDLRRPGQLFLPKLDDPGPVLGRVHGRIEDFALLAPGAAHENGAHAHSVVAGDRSRALGRLVVGMGVNGHQAERLGHA